MSSASDLFSAESDNIDIAGIDSLARLCKYHPQKKDQFFSGLELADDLIGAKGVTLYTAGTNITPDRVQRLINLRDSNPDMEMRFKIKRSAELINNFKNDIGALLKKLADHRSNYKIYSSLIGTIVDDIQAFIGDILSDENIVLAIYKMKFTADSSSSKNASLFFNHTVAVALFSYAISQSDELKGRLNFSKEDSAELLKAAFFHNIAAVCSVESIIGAGQNEWEKRYHEANRNSGMMLNSVRLSFDATDAIRYVGEYFFDRQDFIAREDNKACWIANIILVAAKYTQQETGLFGIKNKPTRIVDQLNVLAMEGKVNGPVVKALTLGLNLKDIFDFYMEMDRLTHLCEFQGGNHAKPYPRTGFKSPTLFICKSSKESCEHYETSLKAVTLVKSIGDLPEGKYSRCLLATPKLLQFYQEHYEEIKEDLKGSK